MIQKTCAFTGHRPKSFPWKYDETALGCVLLKETLLTHINALVDRGVTDFLSGMAMGVDLWCSQIVLELRDKNPVLKLHAILPCEGQEEKWPAPEQERYRSVLRQANYIVYVNREYNRSCMMERNRYLIDHSSFLLAVYNGTRRSGTGMTVRYAKDRRRKIILIDPITREVSNVDGGL